MDAEQGARSSRARPTSRATGRRWRRHIDQAKSAGIDALVVNWWGPQDDNQTETNLRAMLDEAAARGFRLAVDVDLNSPYLRSAGAIQAAMSTLLNNHAQHRRLSEG